MSNKKQIKTQKVFAADVKAKNVPVLDGKSEDFASGTFWQYTSVESIEKILDGDCFWVNNIGGMNDIHEAELHKTEKQDIFVQSFCHSDTEKIPMWYLYGGIVGKGASLGLTPGVMRDYINSIKFVTELVYDSDIKKYVSGRQFEIGRDFELQTGWVFYYDLDRSDQNSSRTNTYVQIKYRKNFFSVIDPDEFFSGNYFIKDYPWEYEKEFRLVLINKTGNKIDKIKIDIPEEFREKRKNIKIRFAPELSSKASESSISMGLDFASCSDRILTKGKEYKISIEKSELKINMDLLERNRKDVNNYVLRNPDYLDAEVQKRIVDYFK